jgi:hypothetical protein
MFRRWPRTWAVVKSIILRHLFECPSIVLLNWVGELAAAPNSVDQTDLERQYLHKRIAEEHAQLEQLEKAASGGNASPGNTRVEQMASSCGQ